MKTAQSTLTVSCPLLIAIAVGVSASTMRHRNARAPNRRAWEMSMASTDRIPSPSRSVAAHIHCISRTGSHPTRGQSSSMLAGGYSGKSGTE